MGYDFDKLRETRINDVQFLGQLYVLSVREIMYYEAHKPMNDNIICVSMICLLVFSLFICPLINLFMLLL